MSEHDEQKAVADWARILESRYPVLSLLMAIPNGARLPFMTDAHGRRYSREALKLLDEGLRPGAPDLFLPAARKNYHGLFIELKYGRNKPTPEQTVFMGLLREQGYAVAVCYSASAAISTICSYLDLKEVYDVSYLERSRR